MNNWQFNLSNWQAVGPLWAISISSVYSHKVNLTYWFKSSLLLGFCFLFVWLIKLKCTPHPFHHQDCFRESYVILRGWRREPWSPELLGGLNWRGDLIWNGNLRPLLMPWVWKYFPRSSNLLRMGKREVAGDRVWLSVVILMWKTRKTKSIIWYLNFLSLDDIYAAYFNLFPPCTPLGGW